MRTTGMETFSIRVRASVYCDLFLEAVDETEAILKAADILDTAWADDRNADNREQAEELMDSLQEEWKSITPELEIVTGE